MKIKRGGWLSHLSLDIVLLVIIFLIPALGRDLFFFFFFFPEEADRYGVSIVHLGKADVDYTTSHSVQDLDAVVYCVGYVPACIKAASSFRFT